MIELSLKLSTVPLLFAVQLVAIAYANHRAAKQNSAMQSKWIYSVLVMLAVWGVMCTYLAFSGVYQSSGFLNAYPMLWLPIIPFLIISLPLALQPVRDSYRMLIDSTLTTWLVGVHVLRVLALGTIIKAHNGLFSQSFATYVGIPDFIFGLSAILVLWLVIKRQISDSLLIIWSLVGVLVVIPGASIVAQKGLPGVFYSTVETPGIETLFEFPMVLAPSLVVPLFLAFNLFTGIRLIERKQQPHRKLNTINNVR